MRYLGAELDTVAGSFLVPDAKRQAVQRMITTTLHSFRNHFPYRVSDIANLAGTLQSIPHSFGKLPILMTRFMSGCIVDHIAQDASYSQRRA